MTKSKRKTFIPGKNPRERALVLHPWSRKSLKSGGRDSVYYLRDQDLKLEEATGLAQAIGLKVVESRAFELSKINPGTFLGTGKVEELGEFIKEKEIALAIMDCALSPIQQRNLERAWKAKVIDRTGLILEIFGQRARTREGALQVELAHLEYQKGRLVRSWTHLERQRGGVGFMGGPGERQIEADRRQIQEKITRIKKELETVAKRRGLHRKARKKVPFPVVALAGYTNAGKSTLFNRLTGSKVDAVDKLFATLDPTLRAIELESGRKIILSDTVGFISDLPTELVAAFRATLEEVREADLILHVRDASNPELEAQKQDVLDVLTSLGVDEKNIPIIECLNKLDLLPEEEQEILKNQCDRRETCTGISALVGEGIEILLERIDDIFTAFETAVEVEIPETNGEAQAWIHSHGNVEEVSRKDGQVVMTARMRDKPIGQFVKKFPDCRMTREEPGAEKRYA